MGQSPTVKQVSESTIKDELQPGHTLMQGQYTIDAFLSAGGFGLTYLARNSLNRKVVIKECFPGTLCRRTTTSVQPRGRVHTRDFASVVRKFVAEAHTLAKLKHPNIVGVHQVFEENNTAYMALDFVEGRELLDVIEDKANRPEPEQIELILVRLLAAVGAIHNQNMLHRDISPDNILLTQDMQPILIDFGAARQEAPADGRALSEFRVVKDGYSPQEFYVSGAEQGPVSDLYALAATFYHLITGELPAHSQKRLAAVACGEEDPYVPVAGRLPEYSEPFLRGIDKALAVLPGDRIESTDRWLDLLKGTEAARLAAAPVRAKGEGDVASKHAPKPVSVVKARVLAGLALAIPIIGSIVFVQTGFNSQSDAETEVPVATAELSPEPAATAPVAETAATPDFSAILNIQASTPPEAGVPEAVTEAATDATEAEPAGSDPSQVFAALDGAQFPLVSDPQHLTSDTSPDLAIESFDLSQVFSAWSVDLTDALPDTASIYEINGVPMTSETEIDAALHRTMEAPAGDTIELSVLAGPVKDAAVLETITVPVVHKTVFPDGTAFETRMIDGGWTTVVVSPASGSDFEAGDILVGDFGSETLFDARTSLPDILVQARVNDLEQLNLGVRRDGVISVSSVVVPR